MPDTRYLGHRGVLNDGGPYLKSFNDRNTPASMNEQLYAMTAAASTHNIKVCLKVRVETGRNLAQLGLGMHVEDVVFAGSQHHHKLKAEFIEAEKG
jgi:hypothetical protein